MRSTNETLDWLRQQRDKYAADVKKHSGLGFLNRVAVMDRASLKSYQATIDFITERIDNENITDRTG